MQPGLVIVPFFISLAFESICVLSTDDRFIKRYAFMKMYESCFGSEVVKEVRKEMRTASAKCTGAMPSSSISSKVGSGAARNPITLIIQPNKHLADTYSSEHLKSSQPSSNVDLTKLQQAILAGFNKHVSQTAYSNNIGLSPGQAYGHVRPWTYTMPGNAYSYSHMGYPPTQTANIAFAPPVMNHPNNPFYQSMFFSPHYGTGRSSRQLDIKGQLESLAVRLSGRMRNVTCIMQELGYLNDDLEPDYEKIFDRIKRLPVAHDLMSDMIDGVEYCKQFSLCVPYDNDDKSSKELVKSMFFFRCYKHKKMEACILKDIKDRYASDDTDDNLDSVDRNDRSNHELNSKDLTELALYEFLYGTENIDNIDSDEL